MSNKRSRAFGGGGFSGVGDDFLRADDDELSQDEEIERDDGSESDSAENGETSCKRTKRELVDRLSSLPEPLLIHILSRLGMKRAVATSVLSKRWKNLWTEMPDLKFKEISTKSENICGLAIRIHRAIARRTYKSLNALEIRFAYDECFLYNINVWIGFAIKSKVKILSLGLHPSLDSPYELPQEIYSCSSLTRLSLQGCIAEPRGSIHWKNLTDLLIEDMELSEDVIQKVLSGCPVLHALDLRSCWGFECLHIDSKSLDNLSIQECEEEEAQGTLLEISAPYLRSLHLEHFPIYTKELRIKNIQSLVRAQIHFSDSGSSLEVMYNVMELFRTMHHVKELELGCMWVKILSDMAATGLQFPESRRDSLVLEAWREHSISGILALLESSPYLETLVLHCYDEYEEDSTKFITPLAKDDINCEMTRLKTVHLHDYADPYWAGEPMLTMARVLLKRATVLEKMVVDAGGSLTEHSSLNSVKIGEALFSYPKSSQKAVVTFDP